MHKQELYLRRIHLFICLLISANFCAAQDCNSLTLDDITNPGMYEVASLTESDGIRNGPGYADATIYYPTNATPPFASIAIVPGFISPQSSIQDWGPFLASHGIVAMTIGTNNIFENPENRKDALLDALITLAEENTRTDSPLLDNMDTNKMAVGGWSMGGGGAQLAAASDNNIKAVLALCPWLDPNQVSPADLNHPVPILIFSGENDGVAEPSSHANIHYEYTPETTNKLIYEIGNAGHNIANDPTGGQDEVGKIAISWLKYHLIGDSCYCPLFLDTPSTASNYMTNVVCPEISTATTEIDFDNHFSYHLYPNPTSGNINLKVENINHQTNYEIISLAGAKMSSGVLFHEITSIDVQNLQTGIYIMNVKTALISERIKFMVK
ncbi:MAG: dienelactone hydrolase [Paraglaciecola sp.]|jgi:dienelactone hydrolase